ncbi:hypothetical protein [Glycomyces buryatensis]|uniref:hypothetical protein n=1 Tax=Glycomyces buryatensis TaxID=2570927 RepID=UPI003CCC4EAA
MQWVRPELQAEVTVASREPDGRLRQPKFMRVRLDQLGRNLAFARFPHHHPHHRPGARTAPSIVGPCGGSSGPRKSSRRMREARQHDRPYPVGTQAHPQERSFRPPTARTSDLRRADFRNCHPIAQARPRLPLERLGLEPPRYRDASGPSSPGSTSARRPKSRPGGVPSDAAYGGRAGR